jgi:hypothetical protein
MQLIPDPTKTAILQPYIGVGKGLIPSSGGDIKDREDDLGDDYSRSCGGSVVGIDPSV